MFDVGFIWVIGCFPCWLLHLKKEKKKEKWICVFLMIKVYCISAYLMAFGLV